MKDNTINKFTYKDIYIEEGKRILEINILPTKHCNFDCIFCPIGRSKNKIDAQRSFDKIEDSLNELENITKEINPSEIIIARMEEDRFKKKT